MSEERQSLAPGESLGARLRRRRTTRWALGCLMLLYGLAIFAPLLAGDRPYILKAVDYRSYASALRTLSPVAASVERLVETGQEAYGAQAQSWPEALASEREAAERRVERLLRAAPSAASEPLEAYLERLGSALEEGQRGERERALAAAREARQLARELRVSHRALDPAQPEAGGLELRQETSFPLFETLSGLEVFLMLAWCALLTRRLWLPRGRAGRGVPDSARWGRRGRWIAMLGACLGLAALFGALVGGSPALESAPYKAALDRGELVAELALFPPLAFGFAEQNRAEIHRPPTWTRAAQMDDAGRFGSKGRLGAQAGSPAVPLEVRYAEPARNAALRHPLGTDSHGRDLFVRLLWGARVSLSVGLIAALLVVLIGTLLGAWAGYRGGRVDFSISRVIEVVQCFPAFFLILLVLAYWDLRTIPPVYAIVLVMALVRWTGVARLARGEFLRLRSTPFALAARAGGVSTPGILFRHLLPNAMGPLLVAGTFLVGTGILTESALSFLGFGVQEPIPSWGSMVNDSRSAEHWWIQLFPGLLIFITVVAYNLLGEALRDALDPKLEAEA